MAKTGRSEIRESTLEGLDTAARRDKHGGPFSTSLQRTYGCPSIPHEQCS